jgi:hypothetical protein
VMKFEKLRLQTRVQHIGLVFIVSRQPSRIKNYDTRCACYEDVKHYHSFVQVDLSSRPTNRQPCPTSSLRQGPYISLATPRTYAYAALPQKDVIVISAVDLASSFALYYTSKMSFSILQRHDPVVTATRA